MRKLIALAAALAVALPAAALAAQPPKPTKPAAPQAGKSAPKVLYVLHGKLSAFTAANGSTPGSITIAVSSSNRFARALKGQTLTFAVSASTTVVLDADKQIADGERGIVKVRAPQRTAAAGLASALQTAGAWQIVDQADSAS